MRCLRAVFLIPFLLASYSVSATPIQASVSCSADTCTVTPDAGNVPLDPLGFSLEVDWSPQHIELAEPADDRLEVNVALFFDVTGDVSDALDFVANDALTLNEMGGMEIGPLNEQFDDVTSFNPVLRINFEVFGPDTGSTFFVHGFDLAESSIQALVGSLDSFGFREARFSVGAGSAAVGVWPMSVPEPATLLLLGIAMMVVAAVRGARSV